MKTLAVINPHSGGGRTAKRLPEISAALKAALGEVTVVTTAGIGDGARLTSKGLDEGYRQIVAIGGDGTLNEVVNGFFRDGAPIEPMAVFSFAMSGSGGDFRRTFERDGDVVAEIARLKHAPPRPLDLGRVNFMNDAGATETRMFVNIASFGLSGEVVTRVNRARVAKLFGGPFAFKWHSTMAALAFKPWRVRLTVDDVFEREVDLSTVAVCNGRFFGGGMKIAPDADPSDGMFDVVVIAETRRGDMIARMNDIYTGAHVAHPNVTVLRGRRVTAAPASGYATPVFAERDGEGGMRLPATFEIVPGALTLAI